MCSVGWRGADQFSYLRSCGGSESQRAVCRRDSANGGSDSLSDALPPARQIGRMIVTPNVLDPRKRSCRPGASASSRKCRESTGTMLLGTFLAASLASTATAAQVASPSHASYPPEFFAEAAPTTALDMVRRLPGFSLNPGANVRGLAGSAPNIVINGRTPVTRSESITAILGRIPADQVERIDVLRGSAPGIDFQGHDVVANVIRRQTRTAWGAGTAAATYTNGYLHPSFTGEAGYSDQRTSADGSVTIYRSHGFDDNSLVLLYGPSGQLLQRSRLNTDFENSGISGSARLDRRISEATRIALNGSYSVSDAMSSILAETILTEATAKDYDYSSESKNEYADLGAELETQLNGSSTLRLNLIRTFGSYRSADTYEDPFYQALSLSRYKSGESIGRAVVTTSARKELSLEAGIEAAINDVDQSFQLFESGSEVEIPSDEVRIKERRLQGHAEARWAASPKLSLVATLRAEASRLRLRGDDPHERQFFFVKPRLALTYSPRSDTSFKLRLEREVSQLAFSDFVASAALDTLIIKAGNPRLGPEKAWTFEAEAERRFWNKGAANLRLIHSKVSDVIDFFPVENRFDAIGNIGDATRWSVNGNLTLPLDRFGIRGGLLRTSAAWRWSRVTDPTTGLSRRLSRQQPFAGSVRFSQDLAKPKGTWGAEIHAATFSRRYRFTEEEFVKGTKRYQLFFEHKPSPVWTIRTDFVFAEGFSVNRRTFFEPNRASGRIVGIEERRSRSHSSVSLSIRRAF